MDFAGAPDVSNDVRNQVLARLDNTLRDVFPRIMGSFTLAASATTVVTEPAIRSNSVVMVIPTNAAAATLMSGAKALYHSANTAGASFTVATADANAAAGTETFNYIVVSPV